MNANKSRSISVLGQNQDLNLVYPTNFISNCKYSTFNFLPANLFEQFSRVEILWFLFISLLQLLPFGLSPFGSTALANYGTILPLCFIILVSTAKDGYNARKIIKSDREINNQKVQVIDDVSGTVRKMEWKNIKVGSLVLLKQDELCPADLLLIGSNAKDGLAFVETSSLDGEIRLQQKETLKIFQGICQNSRNNVETIIRKLKDATLDVEQPNSQLYGFEGTLNTGNNTAHNFNIQSFLLRGSRIKNVEQVFGIVVFTGPDTKLMQNTKILMKKKWSKTQKKLTSFSLFLIVEILVFASVSAILSAVSFNHGYQKFYEESYEENQKNVLTFLILYNNLIPVSLFVTLDIIKLLQARSIERDEELISECLKSKTISVKNSDINDELGQIEYILTDKTGTLTENQLKFSKCWINGRFLTEEDLITQSYLPDNQFCSFNNNSYLEDAIDLFWTCVGICHVTKCDSQSYKSISPDEIALVTAASKIGYKFRSNEYDMTILEKSNETLQYSVIGINKFTPERKRMSLVVSFCEGHNLSPMLICKGADCAVVPLLNDSANHEDILAASNEMAKEGLRTLVYGFTYLTAEQLKEFDDEYKKVQNSISENTILLEKLGEKYEKNLTFVGISGIEDKIIEGVPEAVDYLKKNGIKVWVLTGDKKETAENVVYAARIIQVSTKMFYIEENERDSLLKKLLKLLLNLLYPHHAYYENFQDIESVDKLKEIFTRMEAKEDICTDLDEFCLVVNGTTLVVLFNDLESLKFFTILSTLASSVIFCRMVPFQKAEVVRLIKEHFRSRPTVLAVGDGSNDVSMIQEANVGVGIFGREGLEAANSSDYAICGFPQLVSLLTVHGRSNYLRTAKVIYLSLFKNCLVILPLFYFSFVSYYSASCLYDMWLIITYNVFLTSLPVAVVGLYENDLKYIRNKLKKLKFGIKPKLLNWKSFFYWKLFAASSSILLFSATSLDKKSNNLYDSVEVDGTLLFILVVLTTLAVFMVEITEWNKLFLSSVLLSLITLICITVGYDYSGFPTSSLKGVLNMLIKPPKNITTIFLLPVLTIIFPLFQLFWKDSKSRTGYSAVRPESKYSNFNSNNLLLKFKKISSLFICEHKNRLIKSTPDQVQNDFERKKFRLEFKKEQIEKSFLKFRAERSQSYVRLMLFLILIGNLTWTLFDLIQIGTVDMLVMRMILFGLILISFIITFTEAFKTRFECGVLVLIISALIVKTIVEFLFELDGSMSTATGSIITFIILRANTYKVLAVWMIYLLVYLVRIYVMYYSSHTVTGLEILIVYYSVILIGISLISAFIGFCIENSTRDIYRNAKKYDERYKAGKRIMARLLPEDIIEDIKLKKNIVKESDVSIMFCEIMNFDEIVTKMKPEDLMDMLNKYTLMMDSLCENNQITKIETVNKTYVACCGLKEQPNRTTHALEMVKFAKKVIERFEPYFLGTLGKNFELRIGINTGSIISGVICDHKPQYCLVGDTMNIASRMCTTIKNPNLIRISESTYNRVKNNEGFAFKKELISFKGKEGMVTTYLVVNNRSEVPRKSQEFKDIIVQNLLPKINNQPARQDSMSTPRRSASFFEIENLKTDDFKRTESSYYLIDNNFKESLFSEEIQWNVLTYDELYIQSKYRQDFISRNKVIIKRGLVLTIIVNCLTEVVYISHYSILADKSQIAELSCIILRVLFIFFLFLLYLFLNKLISSRLYQYLVPILYSFKIIIEVFSTFIRFEVSYIIIIETMYTSVALNHISGLLYGYILAGTATQAVFWSIAAGHGLISYFDEFFFILFFITINLVASWVRERNDRESYNLNIKARAEIESTEKLLKQMIPDKVYENLQEGKPVLDHGKGVSVLYADICGFTAFSGNRHPQDIIRILSQLFSEFERFTVECKCYKVHTIGDCYVALGIPDINKFDAKSTKHLIELALKMVKKLKEFKFTNTLNMRIGIHTGSVTAGIVGTKIVRYDIYGSDVDIANLVETAGVPGRVNVSQATKALLDENFEGKFEFEPNKNIFHAPSDTTMMTYLLVDRKNR